MLPRGKVVYANRAGDRFGFDVVCTAAADVRFRSGTRRDFSVSLVRNLPGGLHTVENVTGGDGEVIVDGFHIAQPPLLP